MKSLLIVMALLLLYTDVYSQSTVIENHPNQNILSESWLKIKNQNNSFITVQETNTTIMHKHSGENNTFPFGYYGLEEPIVQNGDFTPRIYIDSNMNTDDISYVMDLVSSGGVQAYQYLPLGALSLPLQELRDQWILPAVSYGSEVMVGFYPSEEPGISEIPAMLDFLNLVHETDPLGRPVVTYLGYFNISNIEMFGKVVDIDLLGAYPVYKGYPQALMTGVMESGRKALWPMGKRFYAVPETFGPILNRSNGPLLLRNNVYQGVIGGAEGIIFYDESGFNGVKHPEFRAELDRLRDEFVGTGNLGKVVLSPDPPQVVTHKVLEGPTTKIKMNMFEYVRWYDRMQYHLEVYEGDAYLLAANVGGEMLQIEFENLPSESIQAEVLFENRSIAMNAGFLKDTFAPYQVHVYKISAVSTIKDVLLLKSFMLYQNYPNPFNSGTSIRFQLLVDCKVKLEIYDILGRRIHTLLNKDFQAGTHSTHWDAKNENGHHVSSGIYTCIIKAGNFIQRKKMILIR